MPTYIKQSYLNDTQRSEIVVDDNAPFKNFSTTTGRAYHTDVDKNNQNNIFRAVTHGESSKGQGVFSIEENGEWIYYLNNDHVDVDSLGEGQTGTDNFIIHSEDGTPQLVPIIIDGANDAAIIIAKGGRVSESSDSSPSVMPQKPKSNSMDKIPAKITTNVCYKKAKELQSTYEDAGNTRGVEIITSLIDAGRVCAASEEEVDEMIGLAESAISENLTTEQIQAKIKSRRESLGHKMNEVKIKALARQKGATKAVAIKTASQATPIFNKDDLKDALATNATSDIHEYDDLTIKDITSSDRLYANDRGDESHSYFDHGQIPRPSYLVFHWFGEEDDGPVLHYPRRREKYLKSMPSAKLKKIQDLLKTDTAFNGLKNFFS